jgi:hypothetical protein
MKQVIGSLVSPVLRDILTAQLLARSDVNTVLKPDTEEAVQLALLAGNVDVFILEEIPGTDTFGKLNNLIKHNVTVMGIGDPTSPHAPELCFRPSEYEKLGDQLKKILGDEKPVEADYVSMPANLFFHFDALAVDVFLQIKKEGRPHWVRRFFAGEKIEPEEIGSYQAKGVSEFWIEREKVKGFSKALLTRLHQRAQDTLCGGVQNFKAAEEVFTSIAEITQKMGVKGQMVTLCEGWMRLLAKDCMAASDSDVREWWKRLTEDPSLDFQYRLVRLTSLLCTQQIMLTDWKSKEEQAQKLNGVAFFADMHLSKPEWIHLRTPADLEGLSANDKIAVAGHAAYAAQKLRDVPFVAKDIAVLVAQHHGHQQGDWLPERVSVTVSPLALVYAACEEMAYACLRAPESAPKEVHAKLLLRHKDTALLRHLAQMPAIFGW